MKGGNQHAEEVDQVEDFTAITALPVSIIEVVIPNATHVSATVGEEIQENNHMAEVTPPSVVTAFQVVASDPPPLAIHAPGFPSNNQLSALLAPNVAEAVNRVGVIP